MNNKVQKTKRKEISSRTGEYTDEEINRLMEKSLEYFYNKSIVDANKDVLVKKVSKEIDLIIYEYKRYWISKSEMFKKIEALRCKNFHIDGEIYRRIKEVRNDFCSPKRKNFNNNSRKHNTKK